MDTHVDQLLRAVLVQMRINFSTPLTDASTPETLKNIWQLHRVDVAVMSHLNSDRSHIGN